MKKIIYIIISGACLIATSSCESFLDEGLKGDYSSENYYKSAVQAEMAVNAIYNSLYNNTLWIFGDVASDDAVKGGNAGDQADINNIDDFTAVADNGCLGTYWQHAYETIARANNVITNVPSVSMDEKEKADLIGQAKFLRAYSYFNLVNIFGQVPLKLKPQTTSDAIHVGLSTVEQIYAQIDEDLTDAKNSLPATVSATSAGRATKGAAFALLAKSKLFQRNWKECADFADSVEHIGTYDLVKDYSNLFKVGAEDSVECVFAIRYGNTADANLGNNLNVWFSPAAEGGYYFDAPTQAYVDCFSEKTIDGKTDPRLDASIGREGQPWFNNTTFSSEWSEATGYLVKKYNEDLSETQAKSQCTIPQHIIRYADVLLMHAEALNEQNLPSAAAQYVNRVRERAGLAATSATSQSVMRDVIRTERRRELGFEFHRFFDVMRYGKEYAESVLGTSFKWTEPRFYYPIPQSETETNKALHK